MDRPRLNFPSYNFRFTRRTDGEYIWDGLRGRWICCTPEEWVRQHVVKWLTEDRTVVPQYIVQEYPVCITGMPQRADIVVRGHDLKPLMLVECKAPGVNINEETLAQAVRYNSIIDARYIMLTNGIRHYFYEADGNNGYRALDSVPLLG